VCPSVYGVILIQTAPLSKPPSSFQQMLMLGSEGGCSGGSAVFPTEAKPMITRESWGPSPLLVHLQLSRDFVFYNLFVSLVQAIVQILMHRQSLLLFACFSLATKQGDVCAGQYTILDRAAVNFHTSLGHVY
jgi:hypothetical protein